jgi:hypothetical protein
MEQVPPPPPFAHGQPRTSARDAPRRKDGQNGEDLSLRERKPTNVDLSRGAETRAWRRPAGRNLDSTFLTTIRYTRCTADIIFLADVNPSPRTVGVSRWEAEPRSRPGLEAQRRKWRRSSPSSTGQNNWGIFHKGLAATCEVGN